MKKLKIVQNSKFGKNINKSAETSVGKTIRGSAGKAADIPAEFRRKSFLWIFLR